MNSTHDPDDPNSPAADMHMGSMETMALLPPVEVVEVDEEPDLPTDPEAVAASPDTYGQDMAIYAGAECVDDRTAHLRDEGAL